MIDVTDASSSAAVVHELVQVADRQRRRRAEAMRLARAAPAAAALVLATGLIGRAAGWSGFVAFSLLVSLGAAALAWAVVFTRQRPATDAMALQVDADAGLGGELRSAFWFSSRPDLDAWAAFHVDRAAARASAVSWSDVYPPVRSRAACLITAVLAAAAFALPAGLPSGSLASASAPAPVTVEVLEANGIDFDSLPADLRAELLALLAALQEGRMTTTEVIAALRELKDVVGMTASLEEQIADLIEASRRERDTGEKTGSPSLADTGESEGDVEWARENMASQLANDEAQRADGNMEEGAKPSAEGEEPGPMTEQAAQGEAGEASAGETSAGKPMKSADAADGATAMMLTSSSASVGEPGSVFGGKRGNVRYGTSEVSEIAAALKRETIEATVNLERSDLDSEDDARRKTQQSWSALAFTRAGGRASFDRARTDVRQAVPEARRAALERYFIRPPAAEDTTAGPPSPAARD